MSTLISRFDIAYRHSFEWKLLRFGYGGDESLEWKTKSADKIRIEKTFLRHVMNENLAPSCCWALSKEKRGLLLPAVPSSLLLLRWFLPVKKKKKSGEWGKKKKNNWNWPASRNRFAKVTSSMSFSFIK